MKILTIIMGSMMLAASPVAIAAGPYEKVAADSATHASADTKSKQADDFKFRLGGYGEMTARWMDYGKNRWFLPNGNTRINHAEIAIPRFVIAMDYKFNSKWQLGAEVEFESGGTGVTYEIEEGTGSENGEYETEIEKGGEVALEQFHITRFIVPQINVRVGHLILPVGLTNTHHEPTNFFTAMRPEGDTKIMPSTWHETGLEIFGTLGRNAYTFDYQAMIVAGANAAGFDKYNWMKKSKQNFFEADNFTSPAYVLRLDWRGIEGLRLGGSFYYCPDAGANDDKLKTFGSYGKIPVSVVSFDGQYVGRYFSARANFTQGHLSKADNVSFVIRNIGKSSPYNRTPTVAKRALTWHAEVGLNLRNIFKHVKHFPAVTPFVHYNYYNSQEAGQKATSDMDDRCQVSLWSFGANWNVLPNLVVKANYTTRQIGTHKIFGTGRFNSENELAIGVAYVGWFFKK